MSFNFYSKLWVIAKRDLSNVIQQEHEIELLQPTQDRLFAHRVFASILPRYIVLCNNLSDIYDQTLQVQKRQIVGKLLQAATLRLQELYKQLSDLEMSEIVYVDRTLIENKLTPQDITILKPFYFPLQRPTELQNLIDDVKPPLEKEEEPKELTARRIHQILVDAVNLIKIHEKARQARILKGNIERDPLNYKPTMRIIHEECKYEFYHKPDTVMLFPIKRTTYESNFYQDLISFSNFQEMSPDEVEKIQKFEVMNSAALKIQEAWKIFKQRKQEKAEKLKKLQIYNMIDSRKTDFSIENKISDQRERRKAKKSAFDQAFLQAVEDEKARILKVKSPWIMEDISDHIREWFRQFYYSNVKNFDRYPEEFEGGTILVIRGDTMDPEEYETKQAEIAANKLKTPEQKKKEKEQRKAEKEKARLAIKQEKLRKKQEAAKLKELEKQGKFKMDFRKEAEEKLKAPITFLEKSYEEYEKEWYFINEEANPKEDPIMEWITIDKFSEVHQELRPIVDEFMRIEYELLRQALAKDNKKKYKPQKPKKQRKKKAKKGKKKKAQVDLLQENTVEELYQELLDLKIIEKYEKCSLDAFIGDMNYKAYEQRAQILNFIKSDPIHGLQELKNTIRTSILGMGPLDVSKPRSICFVGPPQSGKKFLVHAICSEINAVLFDLSPHKVAEVSDMPRFVNLITQMARILQPTVFFINDTHKTFYKKVPKEEQEQDPRKLSKFLFKNIVKPIKKEEKIMLLGTTNEPWKCSPAKLRKCFEKILLIPRTDYGNSFITWRHELLQKLGVPRDICISPLAKVTQGIATGQIMKCVEDCIGIRRRMKFSREILTLDELLEYFLSQNPAIIPMSQQIFEKYVKWYRKANKLAKKRQQQVLIAHPPEVKDTKKGAKRK
ncbi:IQ and AAA domain-containing protein 1-like [Culicoides brevitarsis]|uniref:IQ and AAA domain-containing protein 1-like n=1 Tax=Culicoides brevitarsis TaxID=469753 RepID=UPI00307C7083